MTGVAEGHGDSRLILLAGALATALAVPSAWAQAAADGAAPTFATAAADAGTGLPTITVTGSKAPPISTSNPVKVITADDIARAPASSVTELLSTQANLTVHSFYGSDKKSTVDMRGMGDTATSNLLVIVDGEQLNEMDLSGADLSTLSLAQIERIEVLRGGGAVRFGPGAVAGVINITTRRPQAGPAQGKMSFTLGSYGTRGAQAAIEGGLGDLAARLQVSHNSSNGYRANSDYLGNKVSGELRFTPSLGGGFLLDAYLRTALSRDRYGMPGPLPIEALKGPSSQRRRAASLYDRGETDDTRHGAGLSISNEWSRLAVAFTHRERRNPYLIGFEPLNFPGYGLAEQISDQLNEIRSERDWVQVTQTFTAKWRGLPQSVMFGAEASEGRYRRAEGGLDDPDKEMTGQAHTRARYVDVNLSPVQGMQVHAGVRMDIMRVREQRYQFGSLDTEDKRRWSQRSSELGWSWRLPMGLEPFASISRHTRLPNLDELAKATPDLRPQHGRTREIGVRYEPSPQWQLAVSAFDMRIDDEIYYGPIEAGDDSYNRNYPWQTRRHGRELDVTWAPDSRLKLQLQWAYVKPTFAGLDSDVPLVARHTVSGVAWLRLMPELSWSVNARFVGRRYDGNDWANALPRLDAYRVVDTQLRWEPLLGPEHELSLTLGIQNLFNEVYTTKAYSQTVYPMPDRRYFLSMQWSM